MQKNFFMLPTGKAGKEFICELKDLVEHFNNKSSIGPVALDALMVITPLLLQKPSRKSKSADHTRYLPKRLSLWKEGKLFLFLRGEREFRNPLHKLPVRKSEPDHARAQGICANDDAR